MTYASSLEREFDIQRQLLLFHTVILYLEKLGFKQGDFAYVYLGLKTLEYQVDIELGESEGKITVSVHEYLSLEGDYQGHTTWTEPTAKFNATELIRKLSTCFHLTGLK